MRCGRVEVRMLLAPLDMRRVTVPAGGSKVNGPTIAWLVFTLGVGGFMFIGWYRRNSLGPHDTRRERLVRAVVVLLWLSAGIAYLVPAPPPWLQFYVTLAFILSIRQGNSDLMARKNLGTVAWRDVPWREVQEVIDHTKSNGTSNVGLILENGESVMLRAPMWVWRKYDDQYERDFQRIDQYWLAHRGESWHRVPPKAPQPPVPE
jgi:hypothetical protein